MGGCNSVVHKLEIAGAFVGAGLAGVTGNEGVAAGLAGVGAGLVAGGQKGCDKSKEALIQATNEIVTTAFIMTMNECTQTAEILQNISLSCKPNVSSIAGGVRHYYEENVACKQCMDNVWQGMLKHHALEQAIWDQGGDVKVRLPLNEEYALLLQRIEICGLNACKACVFSDITQANIITSSETCKSDNNFRTNLQANITTLLQGTFLENKDVLAGVANKLKSQNVKTMSTYLSTQLTNQISTQFIRSAITQISSSQTITIEGNGPIQVNNMSQKSIFNVVLNEVTTAEVTTNALSESFFRELAEFVNQQNTLNDVGELVFESTIELTSALEHSVGQVMLAVIIALGVVVTGILGYAVYRAVKKGVAETVQLSQQTQDLQATGYLPTESF